jgi:hypothetical protein
MGAVGPVGAGGLNVAVGGFVSVGGVNVAVCGVFVFCGDGVLLQMGEVVGCCGGLDAAGAGAEGVRKNV